jgi:riboflavin synthase
MFTGIVSNLGKVKEIIKHKENLILEICADKNFLKEIQKGDSISVNGACLTVTQTMPKSFKADVMPETLKLTNINLLKKNSIVNLENPLKINEKISGHFVSGHIDDCCPILSYIKNKKGKILRIFLPKNLKKYIAYKGSVAINGVSLTVMEVNEKSFSVALIPYTLKNTNLGKLKNDDKVNIEVDLLARYLEKIYKTK